MAYYGQMPPTAVSRRRAQHSQRMMSTDRIFATYHIDKAVSCQINKTERFTFWQGCCNGDRIYPDQGYYTMCFSLLQRILSICFQWMLLFKGGSTLSLSQLSLVFADSRVMTAPANNLYLQGEHQVTRSGILMRFLQAVLERKKSNTYPAISAIGL